MRWRIIWTIFSVVIGGGAGSSAFLLGTPIARGFGEVKDRSDKEAARSHRGREGRNDAEELEPGDIPAVTTPVPTEAYNQYVSDHMQTINVCFGQALVRTPGLHGALDVRFTVATSGRVGEVRVLRSTMFDTGIGDCISQAIRDMQFPPPAEGRELVVNHTFRYSSPVSAQPPPPPASVTPPAGTTPLTTSQAMERYRQYLVANTSGIRACYTQALQRNPQLSGQIEVRFAVNPAGEVELVEVTSSTLGDPVADRCVSDAIRVIRFPPGSDSTLIVTHSFAFTR